ncbi:hypothetical protein ACLMJK_003543 [Lecanora helva]
MTRSRLIQTSSGSLDAQGRQMQPWFKWSNVIGTLNLYFDSPNNHQLCLLDCCSAGLASLGEDIEVIAATGWDGTASLDPRQSFTRALIDTLKSFNGSSVTSTQIVSYMYNNTAIAKHLMSQPLHKRSADENRLPALFHAITQSPSPQPSIKKVPRHAHVCIRVNVSKEETIPSSAQFSKWLMTNLPDYVGDIAISAKWKKGSVAVIVIVPVEIWLDLPDRPAYAFIDWRPDWDADSVRSTLTTQAAPQVPEAQRQPSPRKENVPPRPSAGGSK